MLRNSNKITINNVNQSWRRALEKEFRERYQVSATKFFLEFIENFTDIPQIKICRRFKQVSSEQYQSCSYKKNYAPLM